VTWVIRNIAGGNFISWKPALDLGIDHGFGDRNLTYIAEERDSFCKIFGEALNVQSIFQATQVHGVVVCNVSSGVPLPEADVLVGDLSSSPNAGIFIKTADCVPLIGIGTSQISLIHAGWRGLAGGAIQSGLKSISGLRMVLIGPAADMCCYEVGSEVVDAIGTGVVSNEQNGKIFLSTPKTAESIVRANFPGVDVRSVGRCTICDSTYNSYRRDNNTFRNITFATVFSALKP
jgi:copper oxidase (laccase) domain-containing protein